MYVIESKMAESGLNEEEAKIWEQMKQDYMESRKGKPPLQPPPPPQGSVPGPVDAAEREREQE